MIYIASPYKHEDSGVMLMRFHQVSLCVAHYIENGIPAYSPIVHNHTINAILKKDPGFEFWRDHDLFMLQGCEQFHILCLDGWDKSFGVGQETEFAESIDIPITKVHYPSFRATI